VGKKAKVTMYLDHVRMRVENATEEALHKLALEVDGISKVNIVANDQVDTGFMLNSIYVESQVGSTYGGTRPGDESNKAPRFRLPRRYASTAVIVGAIYAIYQEVLQPFLRPAGSEVMARVKGIMEPVYRRKIRD